MAHAKKRTTVGLLTVAAIFIIILIILCATPSQPPTYVGQGKSAERVKGVLTESTTVTTPAATTTTTTTPQATTTTTPPPASTTTTPTPLSPPTSTTTNPSPSSLPESTTTTPLPSSPPTSTTTTPPPSESTTTTPTTNITTVSTANTTTTTTQKPTYTEEPDNTTTTTTKQTTTTTIDTNSSTTTTTTSNTTAITTEDTLVVEATNSTTSTATTHTPTTTSTTLTTTTTSSSSSSPPVTLVPPDDKDNICLTPSCKAVAARMLHMKDSRRIDPCEDFYKYACGGVLDKKFLQPIDRALFTKEFIHDRLLGVEESDPILGPMKTYYVSCRSHPQMNIIKRNQNFKQIFDSIGYNFVASAIGNKSERNNSTFELSTALGQMMKIGFTPFFDLRVDVDDEVKAKFVIKLSPPLDTSIVNEPVPRMVCISRQRQQLREEMVKRKSKSESEVYNITQAYEEFKDCLREVGKNTMSRRMYDAVMELDLMSGISDNSMKNTLLTETLMAWETFYHNEIDEPSLIKTLPDVPTKKLKLLKKEYETTTLGSLKDLFETDVVNWEVLLHQLTGEYVVPLETRVQIYFKEEIKTMLQHLRQKLDESITTLQNMVLLMWTEYLYTNLVNPLSIEFGSDEYCFNAAMKLLPIHSSHLYLTSLSDLHSKIELVEEMIEKNKEAANQMLTRRKAPEVTGELLKKLRKMEGKQPSQEIVNRLLDENTKIPLNITSDNFLANSKSLLERNRRLMYRVLEGPQNESIWWSYYVHPHDPEGVASYPLNKFFIPVGGVESPLYHTQVPKYLNYAGLGHMIAHELLHGFDATGMKYNGENRTQMKSPKDLESSSKCLVGNLTEPQTHYTGSNASMTYQLNPSLILNELLVDSGAIRLAWESYLLDIAEDASRSSSLLRRSADGADEGGEGSHGANSSSHVPLTDPPPHIPLPSTSSPEPKLPGLDLEPIQLYFLHFAQTQCSSSSTLDMISVVEGEHLPSYLRVNYILQNEPLFAKAFRCTEGKMKADDPCPYLLG